MAGVKDLSRADVAIIKARLARGELQHRIAADYDINAGRISEINTGARFADVTPAVLHELARQSWWSRIVGWFRR